LLVGMDDDCEDVVAGWGVEVVVTVEPIDDVEAVDGLVEVEVVVDVVEAETVNCACSWAFAYLGGSLTVTYTVY
jgi:hypothetical protein